MNIFARITRRSSHLLVAGALLLGVAAPLFVQETAFAYGQFSSRKLTMSSQASGAISTDANGNAVPAGAGGNGAKAAHSFTFNIGTSGVARTILLQYCTTPLLETTCVAPTGLSTANVTSVASQSGFAGGAFSLDTSTVANTGGYFSTVPCSGTTPYRSNCLLLTRGAGTTETAGSTVSVAFGTGGGTNYVTNPTVNGTFYVRILTFSDTTYTTAIDEAAVAGSVNNNIDITAKVQEKLNFSVGGTATDPAAACAPLSSTGAITLGDSSGVLDTQTAYTNHSYFRLSTNASGGTAVLYSGDTLKTASGASTISAVGTSQTASTSGTSQFGIGLDSSDLVGGFGYSMTNLAPVTAYNHGNGALTNSTGDARFAFDTSSVTTPVQIASAPTGTTVSCDTGSVRYLGNINTTTKAGVYRTTIAYIAVPTF